VEAKEGVKIERENQTLATITFQNYFRMYKKLSGMTGTADTEASEFGEIYKLDVNVIPTNRDMIRDDRGDLVYRTAQEKWNAVVDELRECQAKGQPVLVGTVSIEKSEMLSKLLNRPPKVPHVVLNAKYHDARGVDRGSSRAQGRHHPSPPTWPAAAPTSSWAAIPRASHAPKPIRKPSWRPIRQPWSATWRPALASGMRSSRSAACTSWALSGTSRGGSTTSSAAAPAARAILARPRFYLSLEDDLMRIFGSDRIQGLMGKLGMEEGEAIEHRMVSKAIQRAQTQVEGRNFEIRKHLLEYDDVMNKQREAIYKLRRDILDGNEGRDYLMGLVEDILDGMLDAHCSDKVDPADWDLTGLRTEMLAYFNINAGGMKLDELGIDELREALWTAIEGRYKEKEARHAEEIIRGFERAIMLQAVDTSWKDHLLALDHLKEGISLRGYGQRDPLQEYKKESFDLFEMMRERVEDDIVQKLFRFEPVTEEQMLEQRVRQQRAAPRVELSAPPKVEGQRPQPTINREAKVGRNDPCPCGSGKKYKKCHGAQVTVG